MKTIMTLIVGMLAFCAASITGKIPFGLSRVERRTIKRLKFRDNNSFLYRMGAGFAGDVSRTHPASIEPVLVDASSPPTQYGQPVLLDPTTLGVRPFGAGDGSVTDAYGFLVRPYPTQQQTGGMTSSFGAATPPVTGAVDVLRGIGYINVTVNAATAALAKKGGRVYVWIAATSGSHVQGGIEAAASSANTVLLPANKLFNGSVDANGVCEVSIVG